jgi:hypothetical protein
MLEEYFVIILCLEYMSALYNAKLKTNIVRSPPGLPVCDLFHRHADRSKTLLPKLDSAEHQTYKRDEFDLS